MLLVLGGGPSHASNREGDAARSTAPTVASSGGYVRTLSRDGFYRVTANFRSFEGDPLRIGFRLSTADSRVAAQEFGVSADELDALERACLAMRGCDQALFDQHTTRYYREHGLRLRDRQGQAPRLFVDVPQSVQRNRARVASVASALRQLAQARGQRPEWAVEAAVALVQTGLEYRQPSMWDEGRKIVGFYPPARALERGYGDCDTKSALLAAILQNLTPQAIIGVRVPNHYLLGLAATPEAGQVYLMHQGRPYVLVEAAGPGRRRPGSVSEQTQLALDRGLDIRIDPML